MKAQVIHDFGDSSAFQKTEVSEPNVSKGHIIIETKATSVNPLDIKIRNGAVPAIAPDFPAILHSDVAGIVKEVGEGVSHFKIGDEVFGCAGGVKGTSGALTEYMLADAQLVAHKPQNITMAQAAALPLVSITAWESLYNNGKIDSGQTVFIHGSTGGVSHIAIQLAKIVGAKVYATASSEEKLRIGKKLGADDTFNYLDYSVEQYVKEYTDNKGVDVVFDTVGGDNLDQSFQVAGTHGTVVSIGSRSQHDLSPLQAKALSLHITFMVLKLMDEEKRQDYGNILQEVAKLVEQKKIFPLIDERVFNFDQITEAHSLVENQEAMGKVVLINEW